MAAATRAPDVPGTQPRQPARGRRRRRAMLALARHGTAIVIAVVFLIPLLWMLSGSLKSNADIFRFPPSLWPAHPQWSNYPRALSYIPCWRYLANSVIVSAATVAGTLFSAILAAYAFAVMRWRGREAMFAVSLALIMLPFPVVMIPLYIIFRHLGWIGSLARRRQRPGGAAQGGAPAQPRADRHRRHPHVPDQLDRLHRAADLHQQPVAVHALARAAAVPELALHRLQLPDGRVAAVHDPHAGHLRRGAAAPGAGHRVQRPEELRNLVPARAARQACHGARRGPGHDAYRASRILCRSHMEPGASRRLRLEHYW